MPAVRKAVDVSSTVLDFSQSLVAVAAFWSNFLFWRESGSYDAPGELKPLLHNWSLSVEEQFYLFFPLLLVLLPRYSWQVKTSIPTIDGIVSFARTLTARYAVLSSPFIQYLDEATGFLTEGGRG